MARLFELWTINLSLVLSCALLVPQLHVCHAQFAPNPLPDSCETSKTAVEASFLDLVDAFAFGVNAVQDSPADKVTNGETGSSSIANGDSVDYEVHGFGLCENNIAVYKNPSSWCAPTETGGSACAVLANLRETEREYGVCILTQQPKGSETSFALENYGILTMTLGAPTTITTAIVLKDIDGSGFSRESGSVFGISEDGSLVLPSAIASGDGLMGYTAELSVAHAASIGLTITSPAIIPITNWIGQVTDAVFSLPVDVSGAPVGPRSDVAIDNPGGHATYTFSEAVKTFAFMFSFADSINDVTPTERVELDFQHIQRGYAIQNFDVTCGETCSEITRESSVFNPIDEALGTCEMNVRTISSYQADAGGGNFCGERWIARWTGTGPAISQGVWPCEQSTALRMKAYP